MSERDVTGDVSFRASSDLTIDASVDSTFSESRAEGEQQLSMAEKKHDLRARAATHKQNMESQQRDYELQESKKDNELRRRFLIIIMALLGLSLGASIAIAILNNDPATRQWAQGITTTILGGLLGAIAGYFVGRGGN